jgi:hypothetical protein
MKLKELIIDRPSSYTNEIFPLRGHVVVSGSSGEIKTTLSATCMNSILKFIAIEVGAQAKRNAEDVRPALLDASEEVIFIESDGNLKQLT